MMDVITWIIGFIIGWFAFESCRTVSEKKERQRNGLTDYYDRPIERNHSSKCMGGEDEQK